MLSLLDVHPRITDTPTEPLRRSAEHLRKVAEKAFIQEAESRRIRNRYISRVLPQATPPQVGAPSVSLFREAIIDMIKKKYGLHKGPSQNAVANLDHLAQRALDGGYSLGNDAVRTAFLDFLFSYVTDGFQHLDTTGTQMGNFQGSWRGGGFG